MVNPVVVTMLDTIDEELLKGGEASPVVNTDPCVDDPFDVADACFWGG